ncbi:MAG: hypothetical protein ABIH89_08650 [Elusimicrobiota bacterium]
MRKSYIIMSAVIVFCAACPGFSFKDVTSETDGAAESFSSEGMFGSFIYQFGQEFFRPDGYVTREDMILILKEYHILTKNVIARNMEMISRLDKVESRKIGDEDLELVVSEFKNMLEPMLQKSKTIMSLKQSGGEPLVGASASDNLVLTELEGIKARIDIMESGTNKSGNGAGSTEVKAVSIELKTLLEKVNNIKKDIFLQKKEINEISETGKNVSGELGSIKDELDNLNKKTDNLAKMYTVEDKGQGSPGSGSPVSSETEKKVYFVADEVERIKERLTLLKKDVYMYKKDISAISLSKSGGDSEMNAIKDDVKALSMKFEEFSRQYEAGEKKGLESTVNLNYGKDDVINKELKSVRRDIEELKEKTGSYRRRDSESTSAVDYSSVGSGALVKELESLRSDIQKLEISIDKQKREFNKTETGKSREDQGGSVIPFWAKVSLGFSTFALFFVSR